MRILLVEDDSILSNTLSQALLQSGYVVDLIHDGIAADTALARDVYDLVILDLGLSGLDGIEVLKRLRSRKFHVPVLILTARDALSDRVDGLDHGAEVRIGTAPSGAGTRVSVVFGEQKAAAEAIITGRPSGTYDV